MVIYVISFRYATFVRESPRSRRKFDFTFPTTLSSSSYMQDSTSPLYHQFRTGDNIRSGGISSSGGAAQHPKQPHSLDSATSASEAYNRYQQPSRGSYEVLTGGGR